MAEKWEWLSEMGNENGKKMRWEQWGKNEAKTTEIWEPAPLH